MTEPKNAPSHKGKKKKNDDLEDVGSQQSSIDPTPTEPVNKKPPGHHDDNPRHYKV